MTSDSYRFSALASDMDRAQIHAWISTETYWALGRSRAVMDAAIDGSQNFGLFDAVSGRQVAYARVVTDSVTFAWLCDVFVDSDVRGQGVGVQLIDNVCAAFDEMKLKRVLLSTGDAHGLYEKFGFEPVSPPENWLERRSVAAGTLRATSA
jgi:GNAT superfamily N-acetyltransferase